MNEVVIYERGYAVIIRRESERGQASSDLQGAERFNSGRWRCHFQFEGMPNGTYPGIATWPTVDGAIQHSERVIAVWLKRREGKRDGRVN